MLHARYRGHQRLPLTTPAGPRRHGRVSVTRRGRGLTRPAARTTSGSYAVTVTAKATTATATAAIATTATTATTTTATTATAAVDAATTTTATTATAAVDAATTTTATTATAAVDAATTVFDASARGLQCPPPPLGALLRRRETPHERPHEVIEGHHRELVPRVIALDNRRCRDVHAKEAVHVSRAARGDDRVTGGQAKEHDLQQQSASRTHSRQGRPLSARHVQTTERREAFRRA